MWNISRSLSSSECLSMIGRFRARSLTEALTKDPDGRSHIQTDLMGGGSKLNFSFNLFHSAQNHKSQETHRNPPSMHTIRVTTQPMRLNMVQRNSVSMETACLMSRCRSVPQ